MHPRQLGFFEVRGHVDGMERHDLHQLRSGLHVLASTRGNSARTHRAVDGGGDRMV